VNSTARGHLRIVAPYDLLPRLVADTHEGLEQEIMAYIAEMRCVRGDGAMSYTMLANGRVRGNMVTLDGRRRRVFAGSAGVAAQQLASIVRVMCLVNRSGVSEQTHQSVFIASDTKDGS
jgi:hypothetical protein